MKTIAFISTTVILIVVLILTAAGDFGSVLRIIAGLWIMASGIVGTVGLYRVLYKINKKEG